MTRPRRHQAKILLFGNFGGGNFGNDATLQAMLWNLRLAIPDADLTCVTTCPDEVRTTYNIEAVPISEGLVRPSKLRNRVARLARQLLIGVPSELYRWLTTAKILWHAQTLMIIGTGLLTDAFCLRGWGPYSVFKWSAIAKLCRCTVCFVSTGAGPLDRVAGRVLVKSALWLADFRSYRDLATLEYLRGVGFECKGDRVYPDLTFSLPPDAMSPRVSKVKGRRPTVGLGLMVYDGLYGVRTATEDYSTYIRVLAEFVEWLLGREYDVRLLIGDVNDEAAVEELKSLLKQRSMPEDRVIAAPITSVESLLAQIAETELVVATRFHNVLFSLLLNKPSIAISFHHKCSSLMSQMGMSEYCQDIRHLRYEELISKFDLLDANAQSLRRKINQRVEAHRKALDEQYALIVRDFTHAERKKRT